ncbi:hypothetical protein Q0590_30915 [Rhodocytophaga aerolata]|uniref:Helix-turn-helix transcriptional regulator n=1 Tax=Rhodocytophaga aerolata TaxID=455078 RepID=A0ABT8RF46_9BACT|nr:hypothetical protein [Rhodocytophaga aerolata]MDO1450725.1 hypothetical protein [Rhodocytophaga aerolata]
MTTKLTLQALIDESKLSISDLSTLIEINRATFYRRLEHPEKFTIEEVIRMAKVFHDAAVLHKRNKTITPQIVFDAISNQIQVN